MRAVLGILMVVFALPASAGAQTGGLDAVAARLTTHAATAGLREVSNPIVGSDAVTHSVAGSLGRIQALFLDLATSEPNLEVTSVELDRAPDAMRARSAAIVMSYTAHYVAEPDDRVVRAQWALPALFNALLTGSVTGRDMTLHAGRISGGVLTLDARSKNKDAAQAIVTQLNPGPQNLVRSADVVQEIKRERIMDPNNEMPVRNVNVFAFKITARFDPSDVHLSILKRLAHAY